jgi:hypothetical protein
MPDKDARLRKRPRRVETQKMSEANASRVSPGVNTPKGVELYVN